MSIMPKDMQASDIYNQLAIVSGLSDQQLQQMTQDPSMGWMAGIVAQQRADMRTPTPPPPQGTVIGNKLAQLQAPQGLPAGMGNQQAMMGMAQADPMAAGIAAAPENVQGAATGGLMALAQGGPVRGFNGEEDSWVNMIPHTESGTNIYDRYSLGELADATGDLNQYLGSKIYHGIAELPPVKAAAERWGKRFSKAEDVQEGRSSYDPEEQRIMDLPASIQQRLAAGEPLNRPEDVEGYKGVDKDTGIKKVAKAEPAKKAQEGIKAAQPDTQKVAAKGPGIPAARRASDPGFDEADMGLPAANRTGQAGPSGNLYRTINDPEISSEKSIQSIMDALGTPYAMSAELKAQMEKEQASSAEGRMVRSALAGIGAALATPTEHASRAIGTGLVAGVNQFQQEQDPEKLRNAMLQEAMTEDQAGSALRKEAGLEFLKQKSAKAAKSEEHTFQLAKQKMVDDARVLAAQIKAAGGGKTPQELEDKLVEKLTGIYGITLTPAEIRNAARQLSLSSSTYGGAANTGMQPLGRITSSGGLQLFNTAG